MPDNIFSRQLSTLSNFKLLRVFGLLMAIALSALVTLPTLAAGIVVNSSADSVSAGDSACTLREAIANANADADITSGDCAPGSGADVISFAPELTATTITLGGAELVISSNVTINGPGAAMLAISGGSASRVFSVTTGIVTLSHLTIRDGRVSSANGGGVYNNASLTLDHVTVVSNTIAAGNITDGGGIYNRGTLTVTHSAIISNSNLGSNGRGGGLALGAGQASIINSTISSNTANYYGGGLLNTDSGVLTATNSTVAYNRVIGFRGGGIYNEGKSYLKNSLLANNTDNTGSNDCFYLTAVPAWAPVSLGYNLVEKVGTCAFSAAGDVTGKDPKLGPLAANGGPTLSHMLLAASPANEKIPVGSNSCGPAISTDQRDYLRAGQHACSIGAVEYNGIWLTLAKTVDDHTADPTQIITYTVVMTLAPSGNVSVTNALLTDALPTGLNFVGPVNIDGGSGGVAGSPPALASSLTISGGTAVTVTFPVSVSIGIKGGTAITNTAAVTSAEVLTPLTAATVITVNNVAPVALNDNPTVLEDSSANSLSVKANDYDHNWDDFTLNAVGATDQSGSAVVYGQVISYTPVADFFGAEVFTYTIADAEFTDTATVTVSVSPVNDAPQFTPGGDQWLVQAAGAQTVTGWATSLSTGPVNEASQTLSFTLSAEDPALFATQPAIDAGGHLTFTPNPELDGATLVTATLQDSGGTAYGSVDASFKTFTVTVVRGDKLAILTPEAGGALAYVNAESGVSSTLQIPAGAVTDAIRLVYDELDPYQYGPPPGYNFAGRFFTLEAFKGTALQPGYHFNAPVTLTLTYDPRPEYINFVDETTLDLRTWNGSAWTADGITVINRDAPNHRLTVIINHLSEFALVGNAAVLELSKSVATKDETPSLGSMITYTLTVSNSGALTATGVVITDILPTGLNFGAWAGQITGTFSLTTNTVQWGPSQVPAFSPLLVQFRAIITTTAAFTNTVITNSAQFNSDNGGFGASNEAVFTTSANVLQSVYLPVILREQ